MSQRRETVDAALKAAESCKSGNCPSAAATAYKKAIRNYIQARRNALARMTSRYGDHGLAFATRTYNEPDDFQIVNEFRDRHAHGLIDVSSLGDQAESARMLLFRHPSEYLPCRKP